MKDVEFHSEKVRNTGVFWGFGDLLLFSAKRSVRVEVVYNSEDDLKTHSLVDFVKDLQLPQCTSELDAIGNDADTWYILFTQASLQPSNNPLNANHWMPLRKGCAIKYQQRMLEISELRQAIHRQFIRDLTFTSTPEEESSVLDAMNRHLDRFDEMSKLTTRLHKAGNFLTYDVDMDGNCGPHTVMACTSQDFIEHGIVPVAKKDEMIKLRDELGERWRSVLGAPLWLSIWSTYEKPPEPQAPEDCWEELEKVGKQMESTQAVARPLRNLFQRKPFPDAMETVRRNLANIAKIETKRKAPEQVPQLLDDDEDEDNVEVVKPSKAKVRKTSKPTKNRKLRKPGGRKRKSEAEEDEAEAGPKRQYRKKTEEERATMVVESAAQKVLAKASVSYSRFLREHSGGSRVKGKPPCTNGGWLKLRSSLIAGDKPNYQVCCNLLQKCQLTPQKFQEMINLLADAQKVVEEHCEDMEILSSPEKLKRASLPLPDAGP